MYCLFIWFCWFIWKQVPSLTYPAIVESALLEGPSWGRAVAPYIVWVNDSIQNRSREIVTDINVDIETNPHRGY